MASFLASLVGINLSFLTGALALFFKITKVIFFDSVEVFQKNRFLALYFSLFSLMIFRLLCLLPSVALFTLTIWSFGPPPYRSTLRWRPHKKLCFDWSAGMSTGVFLSIRSNVRPPSSHWIPTKLTSSQTSFHSTPTFLGVTFDRTLSFSKHVSSLKAKFFPRLKALRCISAYSWGPSRDNIPVLYKSFSSAPSYLCFTRMVSFSKRYQYHKIGAPPPSGYSRDFRLPLILPYPTSSLLPL